MKSLQKTLGVGVRHRRGPNTHGLRLRSWRSFGGQAGSAARHAEVRRTGGNRRACARKALQASRGTVVADPSGTPIRLAYVVLIGAGTGLLKVTSSDSTGKFSFTKLPADRYTVGASKLPYLGAVAGARRPARPGVPVVLANGASVTDVAIRLPMSAAISGVIYDERGQPAPGVNVSLQQRKVQNGSGWWCLPATVRPPMIVASIACTASRLANIS